VIDANHGAGSRQNPDPRGHRSARAFAVGVAATLLTSALTASTAQPASAHEPTSGELNQTTFGVITSPSQALHNTDEGPPRLPIPTRLAPLTGTIALTFDDGPAPGKTDLLLDLLDEYRITATFFVIGVKAEKHPELLQEIVSRGHSLQIHGWDHRPMTTMSSAAIVDSVTKTARVIYDATGTWPTCVRPPYGAASDRVRAAIGEAGFATIIWDTDSADWETLSPAAVSWRAIHVWHSGEDVLAHDTLTDLVWRHSLPAVAATMEAKNIGYSPICVPFVPPPSSSAPR
jgi:peptidoglycan/xylan/chitin deacetylase (PgdA/CDA1 family)